jgi:hypothetical protein
MDLNRRRISRNVPPSIKYLKLSLLIAMLGWRVTSFGQTIPTATHLTTGNVHPAAGDIHLAASDPHPAKADQHPAASVENHPAYPSHSKDTNSMSASQRSGRNDIIAANRIPPEHPTGTNNIIAVNPVPSEDFSIPTFVPITVKRVPFRPFHHPISFCPSYLVRPVSILSEASGGGRSRKIQSYRNRFSVEAF